VKEKKRVTESPKKRGKGAALVAVPAKGKKGAKVERKKKTTTCGERPLPDNATQRVILGAEVKKNLGGMKKEIG